MKQRIGMITLGVRDRARSLAFYEALGWRGVSPAPEAPIFFQAGDMIVGLWERHSLAEDSCAADCGGWGGITLAHLVGSDAEVDEITEAARAAGGTVARPPGATFWGGYDAIVHDPDGHAWEIAHNPGWTLTDDGGVRLG